MALGTNGVSVVADRIQIACNQVNADVAWNQSYALGLSKDAASNNGFAQHATTGALGAIGAIPLGFSSSSSTGNTGVTPIQQMTLDVGGRQHKNIQVTGLAGTIADTWKLVYLVDDNTFTIVRPATFGLPVGFVSKFVSSTNANVYFFDIGDLFTQAMAGCAQQTVFFGLVSGNIAVTADEITSNIMSNHGRIINIWGSVLQPLTGAGASLTVQLKINGTLTTGGAITWVLADAAGAKKQGTAFTAGNAYSDGATLNANVAVGTAGTAGLLAIYGQVLMDGGI